MSAVDLQPETHPKTVIPVTGMPYQNLGRSIFKNSAALATGRILIALLRLFIAGIIVRSLGAKTFTEYVLVLGILTIADWLVDFGTSDIFVREACREPQSMSHLLRVLTAAKLVQIPVAVVIVAMILLVLQYPAQILLAGLVGAVNLFFFGGTLLYRVIFRTKLTMEREIAAELVSVLAMIPLVILVCASNWGLIALVGCHTISRAIFFGICLLLGKEHYWPSLQGVAWLDVSSILRSSAAIGIVGFLVGVYEILDIILISKLGNLSDLAFFSGAQKLVWPLLMVLSSVGGTFYPVIASYWPHSRDKFNRICQRALESVVLLAGLAVCILLAGAEFFIGLLGPELVNGAPALRVLAVLCVVKAISATLGPVLYILHAQKKALQLVALALVLKAAVIAILAPRFGYMGVAYGALSVEVCFVLVPSLYLFQRFSGYRLHWIVPLKMAMITTVAALASQLLLLPGTLTAALLAPALYIPLAFLSGAGRLSDVRSLLKGRIS
jgi:O-antigen/teichoic acid export membrane protein